jgi:hypothetical protein
MQRHAQAQNLIVTGRVVDQGTGQGLPGATILEFNTVNGVSSNTDGSFSLTVHSQLDSVTISVSSIGYVKQLRRVAAGSNAIITLEPSNLVFGDIPAYTLLEAGPSAGLHYAPVGASLKIYGHRIIGREVDIQGSYHTNLARNYARTASLSLPPLHPNGRLSFTEALTYQQLQAEPANVRFTSYSATLGLSIYRIGEVRVPDLLLGAGSVKYRPLHSWAETAVTTGYGYSLGLRRSFGYPLRALVMAQATHWPGFWQFQGSLGRRFFDKFIVGVAYTQLRSYREASLTLSRSFY